MLLVSSAWAGEPPKADQPADAHVLLIAHTDDPKIGVSVQVDLDNLERLFTADRWPKDTTVTLDVFAGKKVKGGNGPANFSSKAVLERVEKMPLGKNTRIIIYFAGHGQFNKEKGHLLYFPDDKEFPAEKLIVKLASRNDQLPFVALLSDSCSEVLPRGGVAAGGERPVAKQVTTKLDQLFLQTQGVVHWNGCLENTFAYGDDAIGGCFTAAFVNYFWDDKQVPTASWRQLLGSVSLETGSNFQAMRAVAVKADQRIPQQSQIPQPFCLPQRQPDRDPPLKFSDLGVELRPDDKLGVAIDKVIDGKPAAKAGLAENDRVVALNGLTVRTYRDFLAILEFHASERTVELKVVRGKQTLTIKVERDLR
jgi:hypothetical protein